MQTMLKGSTTPFGLIASKRVIDKGPPRTLEVSENGGLASCRGIANCELRICTRFAVSRSAIRNPKSEMLCASVVKSPWLTLCQSARTPGFSEAAPANRIADRHRHLHRYGDQKRDQRRGRTLSS